MLPDAVLPVTLEGWLGHPLSDGLSADEMQRLGMALEDLRSRTRKYATRADGTPRRRVLPPPPLILQRKGRSWAQKVPPK